MPGKVAADTGEVVVRLDIIPACANTGDATRWVGVGSSAQTAAFTAGAEAAQIALAGRAPALVILFAASTYDPEALLAGVRSVSGEVPLVGCTTAGEIASTGPRDASVVVTAIGGPGYAVQTAAGERLSADLRAGGAAAAACVQTETTFSHQVVLLLSDGLSGDQQQVVRGAYSVLGAGIPLVGGCAGDDLKMVQTVQFCDERVLTDAAVAASICADAPFGIGVRHGWRRSGEPMMVTASDYNRVISLDDAPALDVYLDRLEAPPEARADPAAFTQFALTHPLGLDRQSGDTHVRFVGGADFERRELVCIAEVPRGALTWFMRGDEQSVLDATDGACVDAFADLQGQAPLGVIAFDCIARRGVLGDSGVLQEVDRIASHSGGVPVAGFYTYGEIARTKGVTGFHNQTLVLLAFS